MRRTNLLIHRFSHNSFVYKNDVLKVIKDHFTAFIMVIFLLIGIVAGAVYISKGNILFLEKLDFLFFSNIKQRSVQSAASIFTASLASSFIFVFACFLCGLSMWGILLVPAVLLFRGFGLGITAGHLIVSYGAKGFLFYFFVILPGAFLCFLGLILAAQEGIHFSKRIITNDIVKTKYYFIRFGIILAIEFLAAFLDAVTSLCFSGFFVF